MILRLTDKLNTDKLNTYFQMRCEKNFIQLN